MSELEIANALIIKLRNALEELHATVWGECSSLLDEDTGGSANLDLEITNLLEQAKSYK